MENKTFGYIRVSSREQNIDRQLETIRRYVSNERDIFIDRQSGSSFDREAYQAMKHQTRQGDTVYVKSLDRFGRNKAEIKSELEQLRQKGVIIRILDVPTTMLDFGQFGQLQKAVMDMTNSILIEVLGTFAEQERQMIKERQREGIEAAKKKDVKFGRPQSPFPENWEFCYSRWKRGETSAVSAMRDMNNLARSTFYKLVKKYEGSGKNGANCY
jgi:DNA invertase Pin-like site-specific DNA recombinase